MRKNSKGCTGSLYLCSEYPEIKAVVLISPILKQYNSVTKLNCATFLIHGKKDKKINYMHTNRLVSSLSIKNLFEWYPKNGEHNDILIKYTTKLFFKLKIFFDQLLTNDKAKMTLFSKLNSLNQINKFTPKNCYFKFEDNFIINEEFCKSKEKTFNNYKYNKLKMNEENFIDKIEFDISKNYENIMFSTRKSTCPSIMDYDCPFESTFKLER